MKNLNDVYTAEHIKKLNYSHWYPTEWVVRTMLGNYPELKINKTVYTDARVLDMGFGDGRNITLLDNIGFKIYGVEITKEIIKSVKNKCKQHNIKAKLKIGHNTNIPFKDSFFDVILASSSMYYINEGDTFEDNIKEFMRVLKKGGLLIANFPELEKNFICKNPIFLKDGLIKITNDRHGLRNGFIFKVYRNKSEIYNEFTHLLKDISIAYLYNDYYGYELSMFILVGYKK